ncbi:MAG: hypothetical protein ABI682_15005 [Acidobacteriota bacterium]
MVYLFGYEGRGTAGPGSEVDVEILYAERRRERSTRRISLWRAIWGDLKRPGNSGDWFI